MAPQAVGFSGAAIFHFIVGYVWGTAAMARPMTIRLALLGIFLSGAFTRVALGIGTVEFYFSWAGPLAAAAMADVTSTRNIAYSAAAFVGGFALLSLLLLG